MKFIYFFFILLFFHSSFILFTDTEYTQYINESDIAEMQPVPNESDPYWIGSLAHLISDGTGLYWQGSNENGDCYLQFDLRGKCMVNCFRIYFYQQHERRYKFKIVFNNTTIDPNGVYYTAKAIDWSIKTNNGTFVSYYLDTPVEARYFRLYFYGNDEGDINPYYVRVDEVRIWNSNFYIVTPDANSEWHSGNSYKILYTQFPAAGDPRDYPKSIVLYKSNTKLFTIASNVINSGQYLWALGSDTDSSTSEDTHLSTGWDYTVKIVDLSGYGTLVSDSFSIIGPETPSPTSDPTPLPNQTPSPTNEKKITITNPSFGNSWMKGYTYSIQWTSSNVYGPVKISIDNYWGIDGLPRTIIDSTPNNGEYCWTVYTDLDATSEYIIIITSIEDTAITGTSSFFNIIEPPTSPPAGNGITVTKPSLGDEWVIGSRYSIEWTNTDFAGPVRIAIDNFWEKSPTTIIKSTSNDGQYNWKIPIITPKSEYFIKITSAYNPKYWGESNFFGIHNPPPRPDPGMGDVDRDGFVSMVDVNMVVDFYVQIENPRFHPEYADVNQDRKIDIVDSLLIYQYYLGKIPTLPVPSPEPTGTATPLPTLEPDGPFFYEGFNDGIIEWDYNGNVEVIDTSSNYGPRVKLNGSIEKKISTTGKNTIKISFYLGYKNFKYGKEIIAAWIEGETVYPIASLKNTNLLTGDVKAWEFYEIDLPTQAANKENFALRFYINETTFSNDCGFVDEITLSGNTMPTPTRPPEGTPNPTSAPTEIPDPATVDLKAQYFCGNSTTPTMELKPVINLVNTSFSAFALENVTIRYYFTNESLQPAIQTFSVINSTIDPSAIHGTFYKNYCEISFDEGSGILNPGIRTREIIISINSTEFNQKNDWSYNPTLTTLTDWENITVYYCGELKWGKEPPTFSTIDCNISFTVNCGYLDHWIPNTGDNLEFSAINIQAKNAQNNDVILGSPLNSIIILPPLDTNGVIIPTDSEPDCNVKRNKGTCRYEFIALYNDHEQLLATFYKDNSFSTQYFKISYDSDIFYNDSQSGLFGMIKKINSYNLSVANTGSLVFKDASRGTGREETNRFAIRVIEDPQYTIRPGDDMQLRFGISGMPEYNREVPEGNFFAVYDHKLLWRANLYIDEGVNDWNNLNPWDDPVDNDWYVAQANGADVNGGQIEIASWTRWNDSAVFPPANAFDDGEVQGHVAYSWGGEDSPFHFNQDLEDQRTAIRNYYSNSNSIWTTQNPNPHPEWANWVDTIAPDGLWSGYIFTSPRREGIYGNSQTYYYFDPLVLSITGQEQTFYPYKPNFATKRMNIEEDYLESYPTYVLYSAGADCNGMIQRACSYTGSPYVFGHNVDGTVNSTRFLNRAEWDIVWHWRGKAWIEENTRYNIDNESLIIPGDLLFSPNHVSMVLAINYGANRLIESREDVILIELAYYGGRYMAGNTQTWQAYYNMWPNNRQDIYFSRLRVR